MLNVTEIETLWNQLCGSVEYGFNQTFEENKIGNMGQLNGWYTDCNGNRISVVLYPHREEESNEYTLLVDIGKPEGLLELGKKLISKGVKLVRLVAYPGIKVSSELEKEFKRVCYVSKFDK